MRKMLCRSLIERFSEQTPFVFMTGDLGFDVFEPLQLCMRKYFINAGVAEQNMMSVAAGITYSGIDAWVYSIAPFCYARPFEQIRNDICHHDLPVKLVGNGGGYSYGPMGFTHHALEDYGVLLTLPNTRVFVPSFLQDIPTLVEHLFDFDHPSYLRLGRCEKPEGFDPLPYAPWRKMLDGSKSVLLAIGPLIGGLIQKLRGRTKAERPCLWAISELPIEIDSIPDLFLSELKRVQRLCVVEEHVLHGSVGQALAHVLTRIGITLTLFKHFYALGYPSGKSGSQVFHRKDSGIDSVSVIQYLDHVIGYDEN